MRTNSLAAAFAASMRFGGRSSASMLRLTSMESITVFCTAGTGSGATGLARATMTAASDSTTSAAGRWRVHQSEEHTSELQSLTNLVCRLLLEKKKQQLQ